MAAVLSVMLIVSHGTYRSNYLFGDILLMICGSVIGRPRMAWSMVTVVMQSLCYVAVLLISDVIPRESEAVSLLFCMSGATVAIITSFALERISRRAFLLSLRVRLLNLKLEARAMTDPLTGLGNRRSFDSATALFWAGGAGSKRLASFILLDIDRFKLFNDSYGHPAGDLCLTDIGRCITGAIREGQDLAVRFGGEEFIVFLRETSFDQAQRIAEAIRLAIVEAAMAHPVLGLNAIVTASLGVATAATADSSPAELVIRSDMALYAAKHAGRNQVWPPIGCLPEPPEQRPRPMVSAKAA